jgi:hypothetical protein
MRPSLHCLAALAFTLIAPVAAGADVPPIPSPALSVVPGDTQAVTYRFECPSKSGLDIEGNGGTIVLAHVDDKNVAITVTTPGNAAPISYKGTIQKDGTISVGVVREWLTALNEVVAISRGANSAPSAGTMWDSSTSLSSHSGRAQVEVPLRVLVASASGPDVQLMAAGGLHAVVRDASSIAAPRVSLYLQIAGHFINGSLRDAAGSLSGSMLNDGVVNTVVGARANSIGGAGGANSGQTAWSLTLVPPSASP